MSSGRLPGKTRYAGRRRPPTRVSGFSVQGGLTGGEFQLLSIPAFLAPPSSTVAVDFTYEPTGSSEFVCFGGYFLVSGQGVQIEVRGTDKVTLTQYAYPSWNKFGSLRQASGALSASVRIAFPYGGAIAFYDLTCGRVEHRHLDGIRPALLRNMYEFSPEAHFVTTKGSVVTRIPSERTTESLSLVLKSCNRCARYLPINVPAERDHLSFSNHCVAPHRRPCKHATFGHLTDTATGDRLKLAYGFQLECRFCKKFEVNAAHNPQRNESQMKEDGARRRGFELLVEALQDGSESLKYRHQTGRELADDILALFDRKCFKCNSHIEAGATWHLDHTRPLALLWPLDRTATLLCADCNTRKRDRWPGAFYSPEELVELSRLVGIPVTELQNPVPNRAVVDALGARLDWFFNVFLATPEMERVRDGKRAGDLLVKALSKALARAPWTLPFDLAVEARRRRRH